MTPVRVLVVYDKEYDDCDSSFQDDVVSKFIALAAKHGIVLTTSDCKLIATRKVSQLLVDSRLLLSWVTNYKGYAMLCIQGSWFGIFAVVGRWVKTVVQEVIIRPICKVVELFGPKLLDQKQTPEIKVHADDANKRLEYVIDVRVPLVDDDFTTLVIGYPIAWLSNNEPFHQGLIFKAGVRYYVVQCSEKHQYCEWKDTEAEALQSIMRLRPGGSDPSTKAWSQHKKVLSTTYTVGDLRNIIGTIPPYYDLFKHNCQHFCAEVLAQLNGYPV